MSRPVSPPPQLSGFEFLELLGSGGFADVFKYRQLGLGRQVAVKVLLTDLDTDVQSAFEAEARVMAQLSNHPSIVSIYQAGQTADGRPFLVMEYCPPPHLGVRIRSQPLSVAKALEVMIQLCGAVETAHRLGILHRDIKPANILFSEFGRPSLADFGISVATSHAQQGMGVGVSVPWAPPEQLTTGAPMGPSSDVYALGATLWAALVGRSPFHVPGGANDSVSMAARVRSAPVPPTGRPDVPESLERTLRVALAKAPHERFDSPLVLARALQAIQVELHQPVTTIDVLDEQVVDTGPGEDVGGTRVSGFVSVDPEGPSSTRTTGGTDPTSTAGGGTAPAQFPAGHPGFGPGHPAAPPVGVAQAGPAQAGPAQAGPAQVGPAQVGPPLSGPLPPASSPAASAPRRRWPLAVVAVVVAAAVAAAAVWWGNRSPDGTEVPESSAITTAPADPLAPAGPRAPTQVEVVWSPDELEVTWQNPDEQPDDTYELFLQADPAEVVMTRGEGITTAAHRIVIPSSGERCVTVRVLRGNQRSEPVLKCDLS